MGLVCSAATCSSAAVPALDVWGRNVLPALLASCRDPCGKLPQGRCKGAAAYVAVRASCHRQMTVLGLLSSGSSQCCWEAAAGH